MQPAPSPVTARAVAAFPRPPALLREARIIRIVLAGATIAETDAAWRVEETTHPPTYYLPRAAFGVGVLIASARTSFCEWKGHASYLSLRVGDRSERDAAWSYPEPAAPYAAIADHVAVYAGRVDACFVGDEKVRPQPGGFYGGWITDDVIGPFKGAPGTMFW